MFDFEMFSKNLINDDLIRRKTKKKKPYLMNSTSLTEMGQAIINYDSETVLDLISEEESIDYIDIRGRSYLHLAAFFNNTEIANLLIKAGINVDKRDNEWLTPLHISCFNNNLEITELLINFGADLNPRDRYWFTPLHCCAINDSHDCLNLLTLNNNLALDLKNKNDATVLHYAAFFNSFKVASILIKKKASLRIKDINGRNCLHYSVVRENVEVLNLLLKENLPIDEKDNDGLTPLHIASYFGSNKCIEILLKNGANPNEVDANKNTPLHYACIFGCIETIELLIKAGSNIFSVNNSGITPFQFTVNLYETFALKYFLNNVKDVDINCEDFNGRTALHYAVILGNFESVFLLIENGADINLKDKFGKTSLHYAVIKNYDVIVKKLVSINKESVNSIDNKLLSPLHYAAMSGNINTWETLINEFSNYNLKDYNGRTVHFYAVKNKNILQSMIPLPEFNDKFNRNLLHYAALTVETHSLEFLLNNENYKFNINDRDNFGRTCLHYAATNDSNGNSIKLLVNKDADLNITDNNNFSALNYAAIHDKIGNLEEILRSNRNLLTLICPALCAAYHGSLSCLKFLIEKNIYSDLIKCFEYATFSGHLDCVQFLLYHLTKNKKLDLIFKSRALHIAILKSRKDCFDCIMVNLERCDFRDHLGRTPLMIALANKTEKKFADFLESVCDKNCLDYFDRNILFYCVFYKNIEKLENFLYKIKNPLRKCRSGQTALHLAAKLDFFEVVEIFLKYLSSTDSTITYEDLLDTDFYNPLHWACYKGNLMSIETFLKYTKSKTYVQTKQNSVTPLHLACFSGNYQCVEMILNFYDKSIVCLTDNKNRNAFHYLFISKSFKNIKIIDLLLKNNVDINCKDIFNRTPLMVAIRNQLFETCDLLLENNIDLNCQDLNGNTALHYACNFETEETAIKLILKNPDLVDIQNNLKETALHLSVSNGFINLTKELLSAGASYNIQNINGFTPCLTCAKDENVADCLQMLIDVMLFDKRQSNASLIEIEKDGFQCSSPIREEKNDRLFSKG